MRTISVGELIVHFDRCTLVDLRSPKEYNQGSIGSALSLPILDDEERAVVGTIYKQESEVKAKLTGIRQVSAKLEQLIQSVSELQEPAKRLVLFCSRGGYRSGPFVQLLNSLDVDAYQLVGGYKAYRQYVLGYFEEQVLSKNKFIVLHGYTGSGKTAVLKRLENLGHSVIDLEDLAQNSGSVFGFIGHNQNAIPQKHFEAVLMHQLMPHQERYIFIESESQRLGSVFIPKKMHQQMEAGLHIMIDTHLDNRVTRVLSDYCDDMKNNDDELKKAINGLLKYLGKEHVERLQQWLEAGLYKEIARDLMANYYDPLYRHSIKKYTYDLEITYDTMDEVVDALSDYYYSQPK